jgi:putative endonuclease
VPRSQIIQFAAPYFETPAQGRGLINFYIEDVNKFYVYILSNQLHTVLYTGFTDDLERRVYEHKNKLLDGFTKTYNINKLLYYEEFNSADEAKHREIQIKKYKREFKRNLINPMNPTWRDLYDDFK